ncbi:hypothetical protein SFUMM280S_01990 [Streptomyces fumanus]
MGVEPQQGRQRIADQGGPGLTAVIVGLGWEVRTTTGTDFDLDASALLLNSSGKVASDAHFVFFNNLKSPDGSVEHTGDNLTGEGEGDDEQIKVDLAAVPADVEKIVFPVSIYDAGTATVLSASSATPSSASSTRPAAPRSPATT